MREFFGGVPTRERRLLLGAMLLGAAVALAYIALTEPSKLRGDEVDYHYAASQFADGNLWWSDRPFGVPHASAWKAPVYTAFSGVFYAVFGDFPSRLVVAQAVLLAPLTVFLTWLLGRRMFGPRTAVASAYGIALFPLSWEWFGLLYAETLAIPLTTLALLLIFGWRPTTRLALLAGAVIGITLLVRPTSMFLIPVAGVAWMFVAGWRRGLGLTAVAVAAAVLVVVPWTIRNYVVTDGGFIPISVQDAAAYGTFNEESASDPEDPYAWRARLQDMPAVLEGPPVDDATLRSEAMAVAVDYIKDHPDSVPKAIFWNGIIRLWDLRSPSKALDEAPFQGRVEGVTAVGLGMYYLVGALALLTLWRLRRRRDLVLPLLAMVASMAVIFSVVSGTRYRAPVAPLLVVLAAGYLVGRREDPESSGMFSVSRTT
ncbi:MAG: glycosyltransferase family 39 protein [Actinomycetota bacterium]|nr:glycosyltransferase family 39 protein [Actinomycetota bacterium]